MSVIITVDRVSKKLLIPFTDKDGSVPAGVTLTPKSAGGFRKFEILIQEKMGQYKTRLVIAHELFHCLQGLTGCAMDEQAANEIDTVMVAALKEKRKVKR